VKCLAILLCLGACDLSKDTPDDRPAELGFITEAILKPNCGTATCHSAMKAQSGDVFDSVQGFRESFARNPILVTTCDRVTPPSPDACVQHNEDLAQSYLLTVISDGDIEGNRMPLDQSLSHKDEILIGQWIKEGARGLEP
jgi:hypothetical protein